MTSEKNFENRVKRFLKEQNCWYLKTWGGGMQRSGIPDLLICCNGIFLGVELKAEDGRLSELQAWNIDKINQANGFAFVLFPRDFEEFKAFIININQEENTFSKGAKK